MSFAEQPFGIADAKLTPLPAGTAVDLPRIKSIEGAMAFDTAEATGDDGRVGQRTFNGRVEGSLSASGINLAAIAIFYGATVGTVNATQKTLAITKTTIPKYWKLEGQSLGDDSGDVHIIIYYGKITGGPSLAFTEGEYTVTEVDYVGIPNGAGNIMDIVQNSTVVPIA